ncbi:MAG: DUF624 domain-containing protein [Lachnospiraceae bacterium]|jgi:uncharacterized membrane protein YesL|nr:DUF624 domain-containing protein [Lachnospiraceae bacterium]
MKLFDYDSGFMQFITLLSRLTLLNILWTVCCIPVVTAGAATAAQYYSAQKLFEGDTHIFGNFRAGMRLYWRKSTIIWLFTALLSSAFLIGFYILTTAVVPGQTILTSISALAFVTMLMILLWVYPVMIHFTGNLREIFFNAFVFTFMYAPITLIAAALYGLFAFLAFRYAIVLGLYLIFGQSLIVYAILVLFGKVFQKYKTNQGN